MKLLKNSIALAILVLSTQVSALSFKNDAQKLGYAMGYDMGQTIKDISNMGDVDFHALLLGMRDAYESQESALKAEEVEAVMQKFIEAQMAKMEAEHEEAQKKLQALGEQAKKDGEAFLAENKNKEGVQTTESGLQYSVIKAGEGEKPSASAEVKVHYEGRLLDGTVFDSSYERNEPTSFPLGAVILGWQEGLQLMPVGSKYTFYIPANLAYGEQGAGADIPPHSTLIFDVELLEIVKKEAESASQP